MTLGSRASKDAKAGPKAAVRTPEIHAIIMNLSFRRSGCLWIRIRRLMRATTRAVATMTRIWDTYNTLIPDQCCSTKWNTRISLASGICIVIGRSLYKFSAGKILLWTLSPTGTAVWIVMLAYGNLIIIQAFYINDRQQSRFNTIAWNLMTWRRMHSLSLLGLSFWLFPGVIIGPVHPESILAVALELNHHSTKVLWRRNLEFKTIGLFAEFW